MNRPLTTLLAVCLALASCKKSEPQAPESMRPLESPAASEGMIDYSSPAGDFACRAPGAWKAREDAATGADGVTFLAPGGAAIHILKHASEGDSAAAAAAYAASLWELSDEAKPPVLERKTVGGRAALLFHLERPLYKPHSRRIAYRVRQDYVLLPVEGGFFQLWHSAPADSYRETLPAFKTLAESFRPKTR